MTTVKLSAVASEHRHLCTPDLFLAKENCRHCYGRGYTGFATIASSHNGHTVKRVEPKQWCSCVAVDIDRLAERMTAARNAWLNEHPEDVLGIEVHDANPA